MKNTEKTVKKILVDYLCLDSDPSNNDDLSKTLGLDSLDYMNVLMNCESEFGIIIPHEDLDDIKTVQDIINIVKKHLSEE